MVRLHLCPFAAGPLADGRVRFVETRGADLAEILADVVHEAGLLVDSDDASTTLIVTPESSFDDYLDLLAAAEDVLEQLTPGLQIASFHPDYVFEEADPDDPANRTNRSPHPVLHLLRQDEVAAAIDGHPDTARIPERNAALMRRRELEGEG